jgi:hypothetical protein
MVHQPVAFTALQTCAALDAAATDAASPPHIHLVQRPASDLVLREAPLAVLQRYHQLLTGAAHGAHAPGDDGGAQAPGSSSSGSRGASKQQLAALVAAATDPPGR